MAKDKTVYVCDQCGQESPKWVGKCPSCGAWNTFKEIHVAAQTPQAAASASRFREHEAQFKQLRKIESKKEPRIDTGDEELNRVLGGGIVPGSLILLGGEPGIGKSTLVLQTVMRMSQRILYISGEESEHQLKLRADRLAQGFAAVPTENLLVLCETSLEKIYEQIKAAAPDLIIIDSYKPSAPRTPKLCPAAFPK